MVTTLRIFDFDNTLFDSPRDTPANKKLYEKSTGIPWDVSKDEAIRLSRKLGRPINPRRGWWGRAESLRPPLVPDPVPPEMWIESVVQELVNGLPEPNQLSLIMTGRHVGLKQEILRILRQGGFSHVYAVPTKEGERLEWLADDFCRLYLLGMDGPCPDIVGPKPTETFPWKVWIIQQYRLLYPELKHIKIWEDRDEHVERFRALNDEFSEEVTVTHVR